MLVSCKYASVSFKCAHLFNSVLTDEGLCCTFNNVDQTLLILNKDLIDNFEGSHENGIFRPIEWTPEDGFPKNVSNITFPRPAAGSGANLGLSIVLNAKIDDYFCSSTSSSGFKV